MNPSHKNSGFTLLELVVVAGLMVLLTTASVAGYRTFNTRQIVITTGKEMLVDLRQAQAKMTAGIKKAPGCESARLVGYRVQTTAALTGYTLAEVYQTNCYSGGPTYQTEAVTLPTGLRFANAFSVTFLGLSGGATFSGASPLTLRLCNSNCGSGALSYRMSISRAGLIEDLGTQ